MWSEEKPAPRIPLPIKVQVLSHIVPSAAPAIREKSTATQLVMGEWSLLQSTCWGHTTARPRLTLPAGSGLPPQWEWNTSPAATRAAESTGAGAGSRRDMNHTLMKGPRSPTSNPGAALRRESTKRTVGLRLTQGCVGVESAARGRGVRLAGDGKHKPHPTNPPASTGRLLAFRSENGCHAEPGVLLQGSSSPAASLLASAGNTSPKAQQSSRSPKTKKKNLPVSSASNASTRTGAPRAAGADGMCFGAAVLQQQLMWERRQAPGKLAAASRLALLQGCCSLGAHMDNSFSKEFREAGEQIFLFFWHLFLRDLNPPQETGGGRVKL